MKENKTEKPTPKKKRDAAIKGQAVKSRDITATIHLAVVMLYLYYFFNGLDETLHFLLATLPSINDIDTHVYLSVLFKTFFKSTLTLIVVAIIASVIPSLLQTRFTVATKVFKIDLNRMNPVNGFKRVFSLRSLTTTLKSLSYVAVIIGCSWMSYGALLRTLLSGINGTLPAIIALTESVFFTTLTVVLLCCGLVALLDYLLEYFHYVKDLMMSRQEVKKESADLNGKPEIKSKRREIYQQLLNDDIKKNVRDSQVLLANPTHIVIGIYFNLALAPYPFVSLVHTEDTARAVLAYASEIGKPIYRDKKLVRAMFKEVRPYTFLHWIWFEPLIMVLRWMEEIEQQYAQPEDSEVSP